MASSTTNSAPQDHDHDHDHHLIRRSSSSSVRRKAAKPNKNKPPRRGMGVAKLERLRLQDEQPLPFPDLITYFPQLGPTPTFHHSANNAHLITGGFVNCFALHCNACHKKKKINDRRILGLEFGDKQHIMNIQESGNYGNKVEVVAVDRKGSCGSWEGGNGGVLREYDFFPAAKSEEGESGMMKQEVGFLGSSSSMAAASNSIDLSLKLSY